MILDPLARIGEEIAQDLRHGQERRPVPQEKPSRRSSCSLPPGARFFSQTSTVARAGEPDGRGQAAQARAE